MEKIKNLQEKIKAIEEALPNAITELSLEGIQNLQTQLKKMEEKVKEFQKIKKVKTITISEDVHTKIKKYCVDHDIKINDWVEKTLLDTINE